MFDSLQEDLSHAGHVHDLERPSIESYRRMDELIIMNGLPSGAKSAPSSDMSRTPSRAPVGRRSSPRGPDCLFDHRRRGHGP
jgi:hypothetical protein